MTVKGYEEHVEIHIVPFIGAKKLLKSRFLRSTPSRISFVMLDAQRR